VVSCSPGLNPGFEAQVISLINTERVTAGLSPLSENGSLDAAAGGQSIDMAVNNFMSHTGSDGSSFWDRIIRAGYAPSTGGENVAAGQSSPADVVAAWMGSSGHKANILGPYVDIGAGYASCSTSTYGSYWTVDFGSP
jgi:uncharacterized protein YkwD